MDPITPAAAVPQVFAQQTGQAGAVKFYERGPVRIRYEFSDSYSGNLTLVRRTPHAVPRQTMPDDG